MSISDREGAEVLIDTSVAIPIVLADHEDHSSTIAATRGKRLGLSGHAWYETYSVLTRLPPGARRSPSDALSILNKNFPGTRFPNRRTAAALATELATLGISGGAVYDALVGATAREHGLVLMSRDRRALDVYSALDIKVTLIT